MKSSHTIDGKPASYVKLASNVAGFYPDDKRRFKDARGRTYTRNERGEVRRAK
jgi:hypothetical protein